MKITLLQQNINWGNPSLNVKEAERVMNLFPGSDLYVLPEMFSTGFCTQPEGLAEPVDSPTLAWMKEYASSHDCAVAGSVAVNEGQSYYNRFYFVNPDKTWSYYDKRSEEHTSELQSRPHKSYAVFCFKKKKKKK